MKFGLIGKSLSHSFSASYFQTKFKNLNLENYSYENLEYNTETELINHFDNIKREYTGVNITIPYKKTLIPFVDSLDSHAEKIGAINCIQIKDGKSKGFNTDYLGFYDSIKKKSFNHSRKALIIGNGGAAEAIKYSLEHLLSIKYDIIDRKGTDIVWDELNKLDLKTYGIIINTTPIGMAPNVFDYPQLNFTSALHDTLFVDLIYNPMISKFLEKADEQGCMILNGLPMLHNQAEYAWQIWTSNNFD